jgi:hypothetical protein
MAKSQNKTRVAQLRSLLAERGSESAFHEMTGFSRSWIKKASAGLIRVTPEKAFKLQELTKISAHWIMGESDHLDGRASRVEIAETLIEDYRKFVFKHLIS